jgi:hypothetical protein
MIGRSRARSRAGVGFWAHGVLAGATEEKEGEADHVGGVAYESR